MKTNSIKKIYSRAGFREFLESKLEGKKLSADADILIYLSYVAFIDKLASEAESSAASRRDDTIKQEDVDKFLENVLRQFRG